MGEEGGILMETKADVLRAAAEEIWAQELAALRANDVGPKPPGWLMSPKAVRQFILGSNEKALTHECEGQTLKTVITKKFYGDDLLIDRCIVTLMGNRGLLLVGEPGTAKSMLSELLAAAISGVSTNTIQGTAGTTEDQVKYSWNYALLLSEGPSLRSLVPAPIFTGMTKGSLVRFEELTRCASEVQDALISILSEKRISLPELSEELAAKRGFSVIATANTRDRGVNDMSAALKRRFNIIVLPTPGNLETEMAIVKQRRAEMAVNLDLQAALPAAAAVEQVVQIFRELRQGMTLDRKDKLKTPSGVLSTAEAISLLVNSMALAANFGNGQIASADLAAGLQGAVVKDEAKDQAVWVEYLENIMKKRGSEWRGLYSACKELNN